MNKQVIKLTDTAAARIKKQIMSDADNKTIGVENWSKIWGLCWYELLYGVCKR